MEPHGALVGWLESLHGATWPDLQQFEELFLQHVIQITPYVITARNKNFHNRFNLSLSSIYFNPYLIKLLL